MTNIKMIVTDLDETLLRKDKSISNRTIEVLGECQKCGIFVAIATARFWIATEKIIDTIKPNYVISADGTLVHDEEHLVCGMGFDLETTNRIIGMIQTIRPGAEIWVGVDRKVYGNSLRISEHPRLYRAEYRDFRASMPEAGYKIVAELPSRELADQIAEVNHCRVIGYRGENVYSFIPFGVGKMSMIRKLADLLAIPLEDIAAFGDDTNDMEMLRDCGIGVAMSNALPEVKAVANAITLSNEEDGVSEFIEHNILV